MITYQINIHTEPDPEVPETPYFWCIFKNNNGNYSNSGCGWSDSIQSAAIEANRYYEKYIKREV